MKTSFFKKSVMGTVLLAMLTLASCAKKDDSSTRSATRAGNGIAPSSTTNSCSNPTTMAWGKIYDPNNSNSTSFESQVKDFVSATLDPESFGTISGNINDRTGLDINLSLPFDSSGNLIIASAEISIKIVDSFVGQNYQGTVVAPYYVTFSQAKSGSYNRNTRQVTAVFEDEYGSITISGSTDGQQYVTGTVSYQNYKSVVGTAKAGTLGAFKTYTCATIK
jgi:hypothetical protein